MKHIFLNLKRFDVPVALGGVNRIAPLNEWGTYIVKNTQEALKKYDPSEVEFVQYFPEAHLLNAVAARCEGSPVQVGCQSVYRMNTAVGGNFGAFTTNRPVSAMLACGVNATIIGHCEERNDKMGILAEAGVVDTGAVNRILNQLQAGCTLSRFPLIVVHTKTRITTNLTEFGKLSQNLETLLRKVFLGSCPQLCFQFCHFSIIELLLLSRKTSKVNLFQLWRKILQYVLLQTSQDKWRNHLLQLLGHIIILMLYDWRLKDLLKSLILVKETRHKVVED